MFQGTHPSRRHLSTYRVQGRTILELHGEIDIAATIAITPPLDAATGRPEPLVVLDLTRVTFLDCSGLSLLCRVHRRVTSRHGGLKLVCPHPQALRLLRLARLTGIFRPVHTLGEALGRHVTCCRGRYGDMEQQPVSPTVSSSAQQPECPGGRAERPLECGTAREHGGSGECSHPPGGAP